MAEERPELCHTRIKHTITWESRYDTVYLQISIAKKNGTYTRHGVCNTISYSAREQDELCVLLHIRIPLQASNNVAKEESFYSFVCTGDVCRSCELLNVGGNTCKPVRYEGQGNEQETLRVVTAM